MKSRPLNWGRFQKQTKDHLKMTQAWISPLNFRKLSKNVTWGFHLCTASNSERSRWRAYMVLRCYDTHVDCSCWTWQEPQCQLFRRL